MDTISLSTYLGDAPRIQLSVGQFRSAAVKGQEKGDPFQENRSAAEKVGANGRAESARLSEEEEKRVRELKKQDSDVRAHEREHKAVGGQYVRGGAQYQYKRGPDGRFYAVSGEVKIDTSRVPGKAKATIQKMKRVKQAALAPANPSPQDRAVAAKAAQIETKARMELTQTRRDEDGSSNARVGGASGPVLDLHV